MPLIWNDHSHPLPSLKSLCQLFQLRSPGRYAADALFTEDLDEIVAVLLGVLSDLRFKHIKFRIVQPWRAYVPNYRTAVGMRSHKPTSAHTTLPLDPSST